MLASVGVGGVALGFGAQSLVKDFLSGIFMIVEDQYGVGDVVDLGFVDRSRRLDELREDLDVLVVHVLVEGALVAGPVAEEAEHDLPLADLRAGRQRLEDVFLHVTTKGPGG